MTMKATYLLPIALFLLLSVFFLGLPNLKYCTLPRDEKCPRALTRADALIMALISVIYAALAFTGLGYNYSPESFAFLGGESAVIELPGDVHPSRIMLFSGVGEGVYTVDYSSDGIVWENMGEFEQDYTQVLKWNGLIPETLSEPPKYVRISGTGGAYLGEVCFFDGDGAAIPARGADEIAQLLVDEADTVPARQSFLNSTYFDEIYHARTAWEHINGVYPYEISHPPLGKLIIGLGISLFGMTPFGWRFMGTLFGVLMLPVMYILVKKLFGGRAVPSVCTAVFACDFMHFAQTRIATIDTYSVMFIMLMYLFIFLFLQSASEDNPPRRALVYLALCGISFGLGAASKWTSIYAGCGLAVLWGAYWVVNRQRGFKAFMKNALFCVVFFVLIPAAIYYLSYTPYGQASGMSAPGMYFSGDYMRIVLDNQSFMYSYHSGLVAEHPYSSVWYQWLLDIRPILYYLDYFDDGTRSSFGAFVNPALCWGGLLSLFVLVYTALFRRDRTAGFILVGYLAQLLPWVFISRLTFEYHYFPCTVFLVLALGYCFKLFRLNSRRWKWYLGGFAAVSAALFVLFYPALSGLVVNNAVATKLLGWLPTWPF